MWSSHARVLLGAALTLIALRSLKKVKEKRRRAIRPALIGALGAGALIYTGDRDYAGRVAIVSTVGLVLRLLLAPKAPPYVSDLSKVGRPIGEASVSGTHEYDFIVIGGGTAGCVLAARLSEDPNVKVLVLEAGISGRSLPFTRMPSSYGRLFHTKHVFDFYTEPQLSARGATKYWPRAKMLGGCSSINAQMAQYGAPEDFDEWAKITGDESWSWKDFNRYFTKFEKYRADPRYPQVDVSVKGADGPMKIGYFSSIVPKSLAFVKSCINMGIPFSPDFNTSKGTLGVNRVLTYIDENCERVSSETAYFTEDVLSRPNLTVAIQATVSQILFEKAGDSVKVVGVEFMKKENGERYQARALKEVIVAAGAVHSPQILMLSGVGPQEELKKHGIPVIHDLPGVGSNLIDHVVVDIHLKDKLNASGMHIRPKTPLDVIKLIGSILKYRFAKTGALATNVGEAAAFIRSDDPTLFPPEEFPTKLEDTTSSLQSPDIEIYSTPIAYKAHGGFRFPMHTFALHVGLLRPASTGTIRLKSPSPWDSPRIDPGYLKSLTDVDKLVRGVKATLKIIKTEPLSSTLDHDDEDPLLDHQLHTKSDEELRDLVRERVETIYHPARSCRMAPLMEGGVVDSQLRVYGIKGLRVCDASVFPEIVSGHTAGAVLAIAEKAADMIKASNRA